MPRSDGVRANARENYIGQFQLFRTLLSETCNHVQEYVQHSLATHFHRQDNTLPSNSTS